MSQLSECNMKKMTLAIVFSLVITISVSAQHENTYSFQANPIYYLGNILNLTKNYGSYNISAEFEFQYAINNYFNISVNPIFNFDKRVYGWYFNGQTVYSSEYQFLVVPGLLFRPFQSRLKGMYIGAHFPIGFINWRNTGKSNFGYSIYGNGYAYDTKKRNDYFFLLGISASMGYQWIFKNGFTISLGAGGRKIWTMNNTGNLGDYDPIYYWPFRFGLTFRMGYSF